MSGEHDHPDLADQIASVHADQLVAYSRLNTHDEAISALAARVASLEASTPDPPPVVPPVTPPVAPLWAHDFATRVSPVTAWNYVPTAPTVALVDGRTVGRYAIPGGGNRCEDAPPVTFREEDDRWLRAVTRLESVPLASSAWQVCGFQLKNDGVGSPPLSLNVTRGRWEFGGGWGWPGTDNPTAPKLAVKDLGSAVTNEWDDWLFHVLFSADPTRGTVDVWRNGAQVLAGWKPSGGTLYPKLGSYLKVGYYRSSSITQSAAVLLDRVAVGTSRESVA